MDTVKYLAGAFWAWFVDWIAPKWAALKTKTIAALQRVRARISGAR